MSNVTNLLIKTALDHVYTVDPTFLISFQRNDLEAQLQEALDTVLPDELTLSADKPDFESIMLKFVQQLQTDNAWKDTITAATGQTLLRNISAGLVYLHHANVMAVQNALLRPGSSRNSIYQIMNMQGVQIRRKVPATVAVRLSIKDHNDPFNIPRFTQFTIAGMDYFNREEINYTELELYKDVQLVQGVVYRMQGKAAGIPYESIDIGYENFAISNDDVYVFVDGDEWKRDPLLKPWMAKNTSKVFFSRTLDTGNVQIRFGNNLYAKKLEAEDPIEIVWAETLGGDASIVLTGQTFNHITDREIIGEVFGSAKGDNELEDDFYIHMGPHIRSSNLQGINRPGLKATAMRYPNVRDALFRGQAEIARGKRNFLNVVEVSILTANGLPMTDNEWANFIQYMIDNSVERLDFVRKDPNIINIDVNAEVYCNSRANLQQVESALQSNIVEFAKPRRGAIGFSVYGSDMTSILEGNFHDKASPYRDVIEYVKDFSFSYTVPPETPIDPEFTGFGITLDKSAVIANYISYVRINNVNLLLKYTPRTTYTSRTDIAMETPS